MIEAKKLTMFYGSTRAVEDVSFMVNENEVVGFLGPNGAGKSTIMRMLTTFIYPTHGTALINGVDILKDPIEARRHLGYLPETPPLYHDMRVDEFIDFVGRARGLGGGLLKSRKDWVVDACSLAPVWKHNIYELSLGYRQRVGLAQALVHDPKVVILDEPTSGLDPIQIIGIRKLIRDLAKEKTLLFSTHILQEASAVSDRIFIISGGRLAAQGTVSQLKDMAVTKDELFYVTLSGERPEVLAALTQIPSLKNVMAAGEFKGSVRFSFNCGNFFDAVRAINDLAVQKGWKIKEMVREEPSLEEVFVTLFRKSQKRQEGS